MQAQIKTLEIDGVDILPRTRTDAVTTTDGIPIDVKLEELKDLINIINTTLPINGQISGTNNLNDYRVTGIWKCISNSIVNLPLSNSGYGILSVEKPYIYGYYQQKYTLTSSARTWVRSSADGLTWTAWVELYSTGNITISTTAPSSALAEGVQHQVY